MDSYIAFSAAALLAAGQPLATAQPVTEEQGSVTPKRLRHEICAVLSTGAVYLNLADCLSLDNAPESEFRSQICNFLRGTGQLEDFEFASYADCIRYGLVS